MATTPPELINRSAINVDRTTNATGLLSVCAGIGAAFEGITSHQPVWQWLPMFAMGVANAIAHYLQGTPSKDTRLIMKILNLEGDNNADVIRSGITRIAGIGGDRPMGNPESYYDVDRPSAPPRRGDAVDAPDVRDRPTRLGINLADIPEWSQSPEETRRAAYREVDRVRGNQPIDGTNIGPAEFAAMSRSGSDSEDGPRSEAW